MPSFLIPSIDTRYGDYNGTKTNSDYFWFYLKQIYDWRQKNGLDSNFKKIDHITIQVDTGKRLEAAYEFLTMQGYEFLMSLESENYIKTILHFKRDTQVPEIIIREPKKPKQNDIFWFMNQTAPNRKNSHARYIGETILVENIEEVYQVLKSAGKHFLTEQILGSEQEGQKYIETHPSSYTQNTVKYIQYFGKRNLKRQSLDKIFEENKETLEKFEKIKQDQKDAGIYELMRPLDHIATRVMQQDRENAILEILTLEPYYPWGAYNIEEQNSSTNPCRNIFKIPERYSPAKVFTAANSAHFLNFLEDIYNTTDNYAYNFGRSLHHLAFECPDDGKGTLSIDKIVEYIAQKNPKMVGKLFGNREDGIRQIFIQRSEIFGFATEYVQRFDGYHGFFTRENVASLTGALADSEKRIS
jgi:hypothetical protein